MASQMDFSKIVAKAWADDDYRKRLVSDPMGTLKSEGWDIHPSTTIEVKPDTDQHKLVFGLPKKPEGLSDDELSRSASAGPCSSSPAPCS